MNIIDKFGIWLSRFSRRWMTWWKDRAHNFNILEENTPDFKKRNPFYWMGSMLYMLLILQVCLGIALTFFYIPDTTPVEKINPHLVTYAHGHSYADVMEEAEEVHHVFIERYDFTEHEREVFEVVGMKDYEYVIENLEIETSTPSLERLIEIAGEYEDEYKKLDESEQEKLSENFLKIMALADEDAEDLIASTYHAGMPITDAIDEADSMLTEIVELFPIYRKTEDQVVLMSHEVFNIFDEDGNPRVLKDVIKDADTAMISSESPTLYQQEILRFAGKTPAEIRDESQYAGLSITDAIEESEKLTAIFANLTGEQRENLKKYIGLEDESAVELAVESLLGIMGKSADTIAEELGVTVSRAYESVARISKKPLTQWIRGIHRYGAYCFIAILMLRWLRMYFCGEFKKPGELTWIVLTIIIIVSTFSGVTGYLLPFDQRSYWATTVGTQMLNSLDSMPVIGPLGLGAALKYMGLGAHQVGQSTILRFNIIHYFLPLLMFLMAEIYFLRSRKLRPKVNWTAIILLAVIIIAACLYLPAVNEPPPNIVKTPNHILPDWYFLFVYFYLKFLPGYFGTLVTLMFIVFLIIFPIFDRRPEKKAGERPGLTLLAIGGLTFFLAGSIAAYWIPFQDAHRQMYINGILLFNGGIFVIAFLLYVWWRMRKSHKKKDLANRLGIDPELIEVREE